MFLVDFRAHIDKSSATLAKAALTNSASPSSPQVVYNLAVSRTIDPLAVMIHGVGKNGGMLS